MRPFLHKYVAAANAWSFEIGIAGAAVGLTVGFKSALDRPEDKYNNVFHIPPFLIGGAIGGYVLGTFAAPVIIPACAAGVAYGAYKQLTAPPPPPRKRTISKYDDF